MRLYKGCIRNDVGRYKPIDKISMNDPCSILGSSVVPDWPRLDFIEPNCEKVSQTQQLVPTFYDSIQL